MARGLFLVCLLGACGSDDDSADPCADVECSGHGECVEADEIPAGHPGGSSARCICDDGYLPAGLTSCVPVGGDSDTDTDTG